MGRRLWQTCPQHRKKRITRARRLTADPTPNRLAAAKGTNKHFRQMNRDQARVASPTFQALSAGRLPLSGGFQITIGSERGDDPFPAPVQQPEQEEAADTMDEIDSCLTGIWNLYANGDRQSRLLLLRDLRRTMAVQEARGVRSGPAESED
ncbi:hypothetical protein SLS55_008880 [Diplodia seriata]|uniref:Uncharacterized protein n=1 Tax=Diplodia seriata TaxID=420778 RepID=A0ABR3C8H9_9PEZI